MGVAEFKNYSTGTLEIAKAISKLDSCLFSCRWRWQRCCSAKIRNGKQILTRFNRWWSFIRIPTRLRTSWH
nr:hypothetical protein [Mycoplasmopsis bovis]